jgi:hypothetical protein
MLGIAEPYNGGGVTRLRTAADFTRRASKALLTWGESQAVAETEIRSSPHGGGTRCTSHHAFHQQRCRDNFSACSALLDETVYVGRH